MNRYSKALRILSPKGQVEDKPLMAVKIVKGEYYSRPVMEKEIHEYIQKTFKKSNQYRYRKDNWLETLVEEKQIEFDRKEIEKEIKLRRLYEQMTTKGMMTTLIQGEGETVLDSLEGSVEASYAPLSGPYVSHTDIALVNTAITASGTGSGPTGGFDLGQDYLGFNGDHTELGASRYASLKAIDSTELDTIVITAIRGNDENGGEDPDEEGAELTVWYQIGDAAPVKIDTIIPVGSDDSGLKDWSLHIPPGARNAATKFILWQQSHSGVGFDNYGVTDIKFQRRSPMNVFVSLDSPEAVSFIRTGDGGTTEKDKKKKVQDILDGSDAYLENQFGEDFPGTSPREVGQEEPQPGIGQFEPEVIDYETWKNELEKSDDPEAKKILKGDPKKTFDAYQQDKERVELEKVKEKAQGLMDDFDDKFAKLWDEKGQDVWKDSKVLTDINSILEIDPENVSALFYRSTIFDMIDNEEAALADMETLLSIKPRIEYYDSMKEYVDGFRRSVSLMNRFLDSYDNSSDWLKPNNIKDLDKILELRPDNVKALVYRGILNDESGNIELAIKDVEKLIELDPDNAKKEFWLANLKMDQARQLEGKEQEKLEQEAFKDETKAYKDYWEDPKWNLPDPAMVPFEGTTEEALDILKYARLSKNISPEQIPGIRDVVRDWVTSKDPSSIEVTDAWTRGYHGSTMDDYMLGRGEFDDYWDWRIKQYYSGSQKPYSDGRIPVALRAAQEFTARDWEERGGWARMGYKPDGTIDMSDAYLIQQYTYNISKIRSIESTESSRVLDRLQGELKARLELIQELEQNLPDSYWAGEDGDVYGKNIPDQIKKITDNPEEFNITGNDIDLLNKLAAEKGFDNADGFKDLSSGGVVGSYEYYAVAIAKSVLMNRPINVNPRTIPPGYFNVKLASHIKSGHLLTMPGQTEDGKPIPMKTVSDWSEIDYNDDGGARIPITSTPIPYADDNFYVDKNGKVHAQTPETLKLYPNTTFQPVGFNQEMLDSPLAGQGKAQYQVVIPQDGSTPYLYYVDHAYHNLVSSDPGEVPKGKGWIANATNFVRNIIHGDGPNTGAMAGYPPGIRGDVITSVKIPLSKLSKEVQQVIRNSDLYKATAKDLLSPGRDDLTKPEDDLTKPETAQEIEISADHLSGLEDAYRDHMKRHEGGPLSIEKDGLWRDESSPNLTFGRFPYPDNDDNSSTWGYVGFDKSGNIVWGPYDSPPSSVPSDDLTKPEPPLSDAEKDDQKTRADGLRDDMLGDVAVSPDGYQDPDSYVPGNIIPIRTPGHNYGDDEGYEIPDPFPDGKPGLDIRKVKKPRLGGSAGEIAGVDADTAASVAAHTQRKKKGDTQIANMLGPNTPLPAPGWQKKTDFTPKPMWQKPKPGGGSGKWGTNIKLAKNTKNKNKNTKIHAAHYEPKGNPLMEKKNLDAVEPKEHKSGSKRIKSPKQFFNSADVKPEFPKDPPPEMVNGWHPKLADGQEIANRFNKLDPQSAKAMPKTGNPHIDAKVEKAKNNPDKDGPEWRKMVDAKARKARLQRG